jgi:AcrR family transcriptional regulator
MMAVQTDMRERILAAAPDVLRRFTVAKFSMEDVARGAGIARQTIYKHFSSRDDLLIAMYVHEMLENQAPKMAEVVNRPPTAENLLDIFMTELALARGYPWFDDAHEPSATPKLAEMVLRSEKMAATREQIWVPLLERYRDHGVLRSGLDLGATVRWLTYQKFWLLFHPDVLCDGEDALRPFIRDFVIAALVVPE